jgi:hypothetical protein
VNAEGRAALRREYAQVWVDEIHSECRKLRTQLLPKSGLGEAVNYTLNMWAKLRHCLDHAEVELSNNIAENSMRPVALGRKNWLHVAPPSGERVSVSGTARHEPEKTFRSRSSHPGSLEGISAKPLVTGPHLSLRLIGNRNSMIWVTVQNVIASICSLGIGREKFLIRRRRNASIAINIARAEFQI